MRNLHQLLLQEDGIEAWGLFRLWEKLRLRASEYKNHRIFTLRCLHNDLIPVSIKLKSTLKSARAIKILRKAEKELLQTRVKSINYILDNTSKQLEECRSKLASIISTQRLRECQDFIDKVVEIRFNKVKQRQLNKFNLLTITKEGNITWSNNTNINNLTLQVSNLVNQTNSQVNPPMPGKEALLPRQTLPPSPALSLPEKLAPLRQPHPAKEAFLPRQVLPLPEKLAPLRQPSHPGKEAFLPRQVLPLPEKLVPLQQLLSFQGKEAVPPRSLLSLP